MNISISFCALSCGFSFAGDSGSFSLFVAILLKRGFSRFAMFRSFAQTYFLILSCFLHIRLILLRNSGLGE